MTVMWGTPLIPCKWCNEQIGSWILELPITQLRIKIYRIEGSLETHEPKGNTGIFYRSPVNLCVLYSVRTGAWFLGTALTCSKNGILWNWTLPWTMRMNPREIHNYRILLGSLEDLCAWCDEHTDAWFFGSPLLQSNNDISTRLTIPWTGRMKPRKIFLYLSR